ncbi:MAG: polysaccharide deacetylase family protein [Desulfomonile sp.]|nr:polysaccharide deacetylase family protein [Desulfomonile sp.]
MGESAHISPESGTKPQPNRREFLSLGAAWLLSMPLTAPSAEELEQYLWPDKDYIAPRMGESRPFPPWRRKKQLPEQTSEPSPLFLTFDDGPLEWTAAILDELAAKQQKATFFVIGRNLAIPRLRKFAIRTLQEGHELGNHSFTHPSFATISRKRGRQEIVDTHTLIREVIDEAGVDPARQDLYFRFPYGETGSSSTYKAARETLDELGYGIAWWDLDTHDWRMELGAQSKSPATVIASVRNARARDVVLLHDRRRTAGVLPSMLDVLAARKMFSLPLSTYTSPNPDNRSPDLDGRTI